MHINPDAGVPSPCEIAVWLTEVTGLRPEDSGNINSEKELKRLCPGQQKSSLSLEEKEKLARFHYLKDALLYLYAHTLKRHVLSFYEKTCPPANWSFSHGPYGKPVIKSPMPGNRLHFNLSHSWPVAAVAVSSSVPCGVDVEVLQNGASYNELFGMLHPQEQQLLERDADKQRCFMEIWTKKEAAAKALGTGLSWSFDSFHICPATNRVHSLQPLREKVWASTVFSKRNDVMLAVGWLNKPLDTRQIRTYWARLGQ